MYAPPMALHRIHVADLSDRLDLHPAEAIAPLACPLHLTIQGEEAKHAIRVKRLQPQQQVVLFDAAGTVAHGEVEEARRDLVVRVTHAGQAAPLAPAIDLITATPKGPRLDKMIDQLAQAGVRSWTPMNTRLGVVDPRETKLDRMERIALESAKQAGRAWAMTIREKVEFKQAIAASGAEPGVTLVCDGSGERLDPGRLTSNIVAGVRIFIGPEGGFAPDELDLARQSGAMIIGLGPTILRIETAAVIAAGLVGWAVGLGERAE